MANLEVFKPKSVEQLAHQVSGISNILGESIVRPSTRNEVSGLSTDGITKRFPERYRIYLDTLRKQRAGNLPYSSDKQKLRTLNRLDHYIDAHNTGKTSHTLLDRQMTVFEDIRDFFESGGNTGYIKLPTASGKTVLFTELIEATGLPALVVMPTKVLVDQTGEKFKQFAPGIEVGKVYGDAKEYGRQVTLTTYDSFMDKVESGEFMPEIYDNGLLILDEGHRALSPHRRYTVGLFQGAIKLGFTATPKFALNKELRDLLVNEIHSMDIPEAVELGLLSPLSVYLAQTDIDLSNVRISADGDYDERDLDRAINISSRNIAAVDVHQRLFSGQKTIIYCVGIKHAEALARIFNDQGIAADFVSGQQSRAEQQEKLGRFKSGEIEIICNANILIEGFDEPSVAVCMNLRPTLSAVVAEQRGGRVLRLDPNDPNKQAIIIDFIGKDYSAGGSPGKNPPITFAQILEEAVIFKKAEPYDGKAVGGYINKYPNIIVSGITVITNTEEIMRLTRETSGISQEGWHRVDTLSRRFRLPTEQLLRILNPFRTTHEEYFETRPQAGGKFSEYISPAAVRFLQKRIGRIESRKGLREGYLELTEGMVTRLFVGSWKTLQPIVESVTLEISEKDPDMLLWVMAKGGIRQICKDQNMFINLMKKGGVKEKNEKKEDGNNSVGFVVTSSELQNNFVGSIVKSLKTAKLVVEEFRKDDPNSVEDIYRGVRKLPYVKDRKKFIEAMKARGALYRAEQIAQESEFVISTPNLKATFIGSDVTLMPIAREVMEIMRKEDLNAVRRGTTRNRHVYVARNGQKFIQMMKDRSIVLKDSQSKAGETEIAITQKSVRAKFGHRIGNEAIAKEVAEQLRQENPELVIEKYSGTKRIMVVTDRNRFIEEMAKRGIQLKE